jgi:uncharacterized membrane protein
MNTVTRLLMATVILLAVDFLYLSFSSTFAKAMFERIQGSPMKFNYLAAAIVYLVLAYLLTRPYVDSATTAFGLGAATYAVYDFTNLATLKNYSVQFAIMDTLWGGSLFALAHFIYTTLLARLEGGSA